MADVHSTAIIAPGARLADDVTVGPYSIIGEHVEIGAGTRIGAHCVIEGHTRIGSDNRIFQFCSLGAAPQDKKYAGEPTRLEIGNGNTIREFCTLNVARPRTRASPPSRRQLDHGLRARGPRLPRGRPHHLRQQRHPGGPRGCGRLGHPGGFTGVHQFVRVGAHSFCGVGTVLLQDLPPFVTVAGNPAAPHGINSVGLKRRGYSADAITAIRRAYKTLYRAGLTLDEARRELSERAAQIPELVPFAEFIAHSDRGIVR